MQAPRVLVQRVASERDAFSPHDVRLPILIGGAGGVESQVKALIESGMMRATANRVLNGLTVENLRAGPYDAGTTHQRGEGRRIAMNVVLLDGK